MEKKQRALSVGDGKMVSSVGDEARARIYNYIVSAPQVANPQLQKETMEPREVDSHEGDGSHVVDHDERIK